MPRLMSCPFCLAAFSVSLIGVSVNANPQQELLNLQQKLMDLDFGKFELAKEEMGQLVQISQVQGRLILERNWQRYYDREKANEKPGDALAKKIQELIDRGLPLSQAERIADRQLESERENRGSALVTTVRKVWQAMGPGSGFRSRGGSDSIKSHFDSAGHSGEVIVDEEFLRLVFTHDDSGNSQFFFIDVGNEFIFRFLHDVALLDLNEDSERIRITAVLGDSVRTYIARDYAALAKEHPEIAAGILIPLWEKIGIIKPLSFSDPDVISAAIDKLWAIENDELKVVALVDELESNSVSARDVATDQLMEGYFKWGFLFRNLIETKKFKAESQSRVDKILKGSPGTKAQDFVDNRNLLESAAALVELLESVSEADQPIVMRRLKLVTGEDFGNDILLWKSFLKD